MNHPAVVLFIVEDSPPFLATFLEHGWPRGHDALKFPCNVAFCRDGLIVSRLTAPFPVRVITAQFCFQTITPLTEGNTSCIDHAVSASRTALPKIGWKGRGHLTPSKVRPLKTIHFMVNWIGLHSDPRNDNFVLFLGSDYGEVVAL